MHANGIWRKRFRYYGIHFVIRKYKVSYLSLVWNKTIVRKVGILINNLNQEAQNIHETKLRGYVSNLSLSRIRHMYKVHFIIQVFIRTCYHTQGTNYIYYKMTRENIIGNIKLYKLSYKQWSKYFLCSLLLYVDFL